MGNCHNCDNCVYIGEGDSICDINHTIVLDDWCPTDEYGNCCKISNHKEIRKQERANELKERIRFCVAQFKKHNISYTILCETNAHIRAKRISDNKEFDFWARTGKILGNTKNRGISAFIKILKGEI